MDVTKIYTTVLICEKDNCNCSIPKCYVVCTCLLFSLSSAINFKDSKHIRRMH